MWAWRDDPLVKVKTMHYYKGHEFNTKTQSGSQSPVIPALGSNALFRTLWAHTHRKTHMHIIKNEIILFFKKWSGRKLQRKAGTDEGSLWRWSTQCLHRIRAQEEADIHASGPQSETAPLGKTKSRAAPLLLCRGHSGFTLEPQRWVS